MKKSAIALGVVLATVANSSYALVVYNKGHVQGEMRQNSAEISKDIQESATNTVKNAHRLLIEMANNINGSTMIEAEQKKVNATAILDADMKAREQEIATKNALEIQREIRQVKADYGMATGQGYRACTVAKDTQVMAKMNRQANEIAETNERNNSSVAGKLADRVDARNRRQEIHNTHFCNESDVEQGRCKEVSNHANMDTNASVLFTPSRTGSTSDVAKDMVREHIMGDAPQTIPSEMGSTALGQAYLYAQNQQTALKAMPNYALSYIQAFSTVREDLKDAQGNPISPKEHSQAIVGRYYGGDEAVNWIKTLVTQRPRGLLVELSNSQDIMVWQMHQLNELANIELATKASGLLSLADSEDTKIQKQYIHLKNAKFKNIAR